MPTAKFISNLYYLELSNNLAPSFSHGLNTALYSQQTEKPRYSFTTRRTGSTLLSWNVDNIKKTQRADFWEWYKDVLINGELDFDVVDHRSRVLFSCYWDNWKESWKANGCRHNIQLDLESPYQWTPSAHAIYFLDTGLTNYLQSGNDLTISSCQLLTQTDNALVTKVDGFALYLSDADTTGAQNNSAVIKQQKGNTSTSLFCQFYSAALGADETLDLVAIDNGTYNFKLQLVGVTGVGNDLQLVINDTVISNFSSEFDTENWFDCACSYDAVNGKTYLYLTNSATGTNWTFENDFLFGTTLLSSSMITNASPSETVQDATYTTVTLLDKSASNVMTGTTIDGTLLQNPMIFDDVLTPVDFNFLRRLCFNRNKKEFTYGSSLTFENSGIYSYEAGIHSLGV